MAGVRVPPLLNEYILVGFQERRNPSLHECKTGQVTTNLDADSFVQSAAIDQTSINLLIDSNKNNNNHGQVSTMEGPSSF